MWKFKIIANKENVTICKLLEIGEETNKTEGLKSRKIKVTCQNTDCFQRPARTEELGNTYVQGRGEGAEGA